MKTDSKWVEFTDFELESMLNDYPAYSQMHDAQKAIFSRLLFARHSQKDKPQVTMTVKDIDLGEVEGKYVGDMIKNDQAESPKNMDGLSRFKLFLKAGLPSSSPSAFSMGKDSSLEDCVFRLTWNAPAGVTSKISLIKLVRVLTQCGLSEAKKHVELFDSLFFEKPSQLAHFKDNFNQLLEENFLFYVNYL